MTSLKFSKFNFTAAVDNIYAQFAPVNRGLNAAYIMLQQPFQKYFWYARMTSLKISKFDFSATISNIDAQFASVNKGLNSASIRLKNFSKVLPVCVNDVMKFSKFYFTAAVDNIYA